MAVTKLPTSRWWNRGSPEPTEPTGEETVQSTVVPLVKSTDAAAVATPAATSPATDPPPPSSTPSQFAPETVPEFVREYALDLAPLTILTNGDAAWVATGLGYREWTNQDFAREFLHWVAREYPDCAGKKISAGDIEVHLLPRFQAHTGRIHLALGSLLRGLGKVTEKSARSYMDWTGAQRELVEYRVPRVRRS
jgi:hypothetical protein